MSIATVGQEKYDFQDLVCIEMILRFYERTRVEFKVEPEGGEDAEMVFFDIDTNQSNRFEIQVKGAEGTISLDTIAECLAHFPDRKAENLLFERLISDTNRFVILVMSGRCDNEASVYIASNWQGHSHPQSKVKQKYAKALLEKLDAVVIDNKDERLKKGRTERLKQVVVSASANIKDVCSALHRLIIIEQVSRDTLTENCGHFLRKHHRVPVDRINTLIDRLRDIVKTAKTEQTDVIPNIRFELVKFTQSPFRPIGYITHGRESELQSVLSNSSVLLISGSPRIGKTSIARWIAAEFQEQGYEVKELSDIGETERFLLDAVDAQRLVLLDDPLGGAHSIPEPNRVLSNIERLISRLAPNRRLIVTQAQDRLLEVTRKNHLSEIKTANKAWLNIGDNITEFSCKLWNQLGKQYTVSEPLFNVVSNALQSNELDLEAGCLEYLAINSQKIKDPTDLTQIKRLAREDAVTLGRALSNEGGKNLLMGLAVATNPGQAVAERELAFVLGNGGKTLLGKSEVLSSGFTFVGNRKFYNSQDEPTYENPPELSENENKILESLELRRIIEWVEQERVSFTHPFYRSAAETLFDGTTRKSKEFIYTLIKRGIFNLSPITSRATARNIDWVYERLTTEQDKRDLVTLAIEALDSSYPSTRDICFGFLIRQLPNLSDDLRDQLPKWVNKVMWISLSLVGWIDGEPRLPMGEKLTIEHNPFSFSDINGIEKTLTLLNGDSDTKITPEYAWKALQYYENKADEMTNQALSRLLSYNEALIRAQAIKIWLRCPRQNDEDVLQRIFMEDHPAISKASLEGAIRVWNNCDNQRQCVLIKGLKKFAISPASASAMIKPLLVFEREEYTGVETPPWTIFEAVLPSVLDVLPESTRVNDARLFNVINIASSQLSTESMLQIIDSWIMMLKRVAFKRIPDDYALGITQILINITKNCKELRLERIKQLISLHGTGALARVIADLVDNWQELTEMEKDLIVEILREDRSDSNWLRGIVLTRTQVPLVLEKEILPNGVSLNDDPVDLIRNLPPKLLSTAVRVYVGSPQPLWFIGTYHNGKDTWAKVIEKIAENPLHPLFDKAWGEITIRGDGEYVASIIKVIGTAHSEKVFEQLLQHKLRISGNFMPEAWAALLDLAPSSEIRTDWIKIMASHANKVLNYLGEAKSWLSGENLKEFLENFEQDFLYIKLLDTLSNMDVLTDLELKKNTLELMQKLFEHKPPLYHDTCSFIQNLMQKIGYSDSELSIIEEHRTSLIEKHLELTDSDSEKIDCWIF